MAEEGTIKRRRRTPPEPIAPGTRKNVTFLAGSETYNLLVKASVETGRSISDLLEIHLGKNLGGYLKPTFENVFFGSSDALDLLRKYAMILSLYTKDRDWRDNEAAQVAILAAIHALNGRTFPVDTNSFGIGSDSSDPRVAELNSAWGAGVQFGTLLAGPLDQTNIGSFDDKEPSGSEQKD